MFRALSAFRRFTTVPELIKVENIDKVQLITLNRPKALNALNTQLLNELTSACNSADANPAIGAIVITGSEKAFAAGADIKEMAPLSFVQVYMSDLFRQVSDLSKIRKPLIAAVNGLALGGGCELAMICDIVLAGDSAKFGQPEIALGTIPGVGGTQRLTRAIGKSRAMELILTGEQITAQEAVQRGLASRVVPKEKLVEEAVETAKKITRFSLPVVMMAKECINRAFETTLEEGLNFERRMFFSTFALEDRKEGVAAFIEKRQPVFKNK